MRHSEIRRDPEKARAWRRRTAKALPPMSAKRRATVTDRKAVLRAVFDRDGGCVMRPGAAYYSPEAPCCEGFWDGHEPLRRSQGGDALDPAQVLTLCRAHHDHVHRNVAWAVDHGLLRRKFDPGRASTPPGVRPGVESDGRVA